MAGNMYAPKDAHDLKPAYPRMAADVTSEDNRWLDRQ
jgi:hypothetical protein